VLGATPGYQPEHPPQPFEYNVGDRSSL